MRTIICFICIFLIIGTLASSEKNEKLLEKIEETFSRITTFSASFKEELIPILGKTQYFEGTIDIARSGKLRMEIASPEKQLIVYDGEIAWLYLPEEHYCMKYSSMQESSFSRIPGYLFDPFNNLRVDTISADTQFISITFIPEKDNDFFSQVDIIISSTTLLPYSLTLKDKIGNVTIYSFTHISVNAKKEINYTFTPPEGTEIIEQ